MTIVEEKKNHKNTRSILYFYQRMSLYSDCIKSNDVMLKKKKLFQNQK